VNGPRHFRSGLLVVVLTLATTNVRGQVSRAISAHPPVHSFSPEIVQAVAAKLPKYDPTAAEKSNSDEVAASNDAYESDGVLYLPKVTVRKDRLSTPSDFEFLTPKGRMELAFKKYPGVRIGNILGLNDGYAAAMQVEDREVARKESVKETVERTRTDNGPESRRIDQLLKAALARPSMFWAGDKGP
jgi:hypothetical protein